MAKMPFKARARLCWVSVKLIFIQKIVKITSLINVEFTWSDLINAFAYDFTNFRRKYEYRMMLAFAVISFTN